MRPALAPAAKRKWTLRRRKRCSGKSALYRSLRRRCWRRLHSPPGHLDGATRAEQIGDQRIIREMVINGGMIEVGSDEAPANELRPSWIDQRSVLDRPYRHLW
jgi:hypothetical protein